MKIGFIVGYDIFYAAIKDGYLTRPTHILALEDLAALGHECYFLSRADATDDLVLSGVKCIANQHINENPGIYFDKFVSFGSLDHGFFEKTKKLYFQFWTDPHQWFTNPTYAAYWMAVLPRCTAVFTEQAYQGAFVKTMVPTVDVHTLTFGTDIKLFSQFKKPFDERLYDLGIDVREPLKGLDHAQELLPFLQSAGVKLAPQFLNSMDRTQYANLLSQCRFMYHPSIMDGLARQILEAAAMDVQSIVSIDSPGNMMKQRDLDLIPIELGSYISWVPDMRMIVTRSVEKIAADIVNVIKGPRSFCPNLDPYDISVSRKWLVDFLDTPL